MTLLDYILISAVACLLALTTWAWQKLEKYETRQRQDALYGPPPVTVEQILERAKHRKP